VRSSWLLAVALIALGLIGIVWSLPQLEHGLIEVPQHWWSALAAGPLVLGAILGLRTWLRDRQRT